MKSNIKISLTEKDKIKILKASKRQVENELGLFLNVGHKVYKNKKAYDRKRDRKIIFD